MNSISLAWRLPPSTLTLDRDEVHVWVASLTTGPAQIESFRDSLVGQELKRAARYHFRRDRDRFIVARALLRRILGWYLSLPPKQLKFCYNPQGKPELARETGGQAISFNLSHSHGLALYAVTRERRVGVDIERLDPRKAEREVAERFFSQGEVASLNSLPDAMYAEGFFRCWTRKEAYIKARGQGLSLGLDKFEVSLIPGEPAALLRTHGDPQEACRWSLHHLTPAPGYVAALVVEGHDWNLHCWQWLENFTYLGSLPTCA